jgi:DNA polymerase III subunit epsilon
VRSHRPKPPPSAHRRLPWHRAEFAALDFEATGLDFDRDSIISFGVVPIRRARIEVGAAIYELIDPGSVPHSRESITIHGIRPVDLVGEQSLDDASSKLAEAIAGQFLVTWWAGVEAAFLHKLFGGGRRRWLRRCIDVRKLVQWFERQADPSWQPSTLTEVADRYGVPVARPHHALDDALVTAQLFLMTASRFAARGRPNVRDMIDESLAEAPLLRGPRAPI